MVSRLLPYLREGVVVSTTFNELRLSGKKVGFNATIWLMTAKSELIQDNKISPSDAKHADYFIRTYCGQRFRLLKELGVVTIIMVFDRNSTPIKARMKGISGPDAQFVPDRDTVRNIFEADKRVEFIVAPYEADAQTTQLPYLAYKGQIVVVISGDGDLIVGMGHSLNSMSSFMPSSSPSESIRTSRTTPSPSPPPPLVAPPSVVATPPVPLFPPLLLIPEEEEECCSNKRKNSSMVWEHFVKMKNVDGSMRRFNYVLEMCILAGYDYIPEFEKIDAKTADNLIKKYKNFTAVTNGRDVKLKLKRKNDIDDTSKFKVATVFRNAIKAFTYQQVYDLATRTCKRLCDKYLRYAKLRNDHARILGPILIDEEVHLIATMMRSSVIENRDRYSGKEGKADVKREHNNMSDSNSNS
ncbi:hypothetical protein ACLB2K_041660 [Fragaria x ananassa]